jgi:Methyltransferase domain
LLTGAEVGVQTGAFSQSILSDWTSCTKFYLVDLWKHQENYHDHANANDQVQEQYFETTKTALQAYENKTIFLRMTSVEAASHVPNQTLDFVYIDARHDYCGVKEDLNAYWPKLRPGGIMAGYVSRREFALPMTNVPTLCHRDWLIFLLTLCVHLCDSVYPFSHDFMTAADVRAVSEQDWSICMDGTIHEGAVRGAVEEFAVQHGLVLSVMYIENGHFASWLMQKQTIPECVNTSQMTKS